MKGKHHKELFKRNLHSGLKSTNILYSVSIIALLILFNFLYNNKIIYVTTMLLSGVAATFYSKNMIVILAVSILSAIIVAPLISCMTREGMENSVPTPPQTPSVSPDIIENKNDNINALVPDDTSVNVPSLNKLSVTPKKTTTLDNLSQIAKKNDTDIATNTDEEKKQAFGQRELTPAQYNSYGSNADDIDINSRHKPKLDYAATLESAYDSLDKLLSSDAIKTMSTDTARLAEKQQQLMGNMTKIQPLIEKAGSVLDKIPNLGNMDSMIETLKNKVEMFSPKNKP